MRKRIRLDVEGVDAAQKISILGSLATGVWIPPAKVHCEGISKIEPIDLRLIQNRLNSVVKLLAIGEDTPSGWIFRVHPALVSKTHPFANVRNEYNAVALHGDAAGDVMLYGKGAGRFPTSSAVLSDIIFISRQIATGVAGHLPYVSGQNHRTIKFAPFAELTSRYYLRISTRDKPGVLAKVTGILGRHNVSLASVHQDVFEDGADRRTVPIILLSHKTREASIAASVRLIDRLPTTAAKTIVLRME